MRSKPRTRLPWRPRRTNYGTILPTSRFDTDNDDREDDVLPTTRDSSSTDDVDHPLDVFMNGEKIHRSCFGKRTAVYVFLSLSVGWGLGYWLPFVYSVAALTVLIIIYLVVVLVWRHKLGMTGPSELTDIESPLVERSEEELLSDPMKNRKDHPIQRLFIIDTVSGLRAPVNALDHLHTLDNEFFHGKMLVMIKTDKMDRPIRDHMGNKQRRFEFQFQIKLKKIPPGKVYFACQLHHPIKLGIVQRALVGASMTFIKSKNSDFRYSVNGAEPFMAFPIDQGMNKVIRTDPLDKPPTLGGELPESNVKEIRWNLDDTYTMALWSAYVDFLDWKCLNLPGIRPFSLTSVIQRQPIHMLVYFDNEDPIVDLEVSNEDHCGLGMAASRYLKKNGNESPNEMKSSEELEEEALLELGEGLYVYSGQRIRLINDGSPSSFVNDGGGLAVLQDSSPSCILMEKAGTKSKLFRNGDIVTIKHCSITADDKMDVRYLSLHRGWWLKWVRSTPKRNGFFSLVFDEGTDPKLPFLTLGHPLKLKHVRWSDYDVGVSSEASTMYGGRLLGLYRHRGTLGDGENQSDPTELENPWMEPIRFRTVEYDDFYHMDGASGESPVQSGRGSIPRSESFVEASKSSIEVPVWLEVFNRNERRTHLVYGIHLTESITGVSKFILRNGSELAPLLRTATNLRSEGANDDLVTRRKSNHDVARKVRRNFGKFPKNTNDGSNVGKRSITGSGSVVRRLDRPRRLQPKNKAASASRQIEQKKFDSATKTSFTAIAEGLGESSVYWEELNGDLSSTEVSRLKAGKILQHLFRRAAESSHGGLDSSVSLLLRSFSLKGVYDWQFLTGGSLEFGICPERKYLIAESIVCHCIWESHWREEWCGLYSDGVVFWKAQACSAYIEIPIHEILGCRRMKGSFFVQGEEVLAIDTVWSCHYVAFRDLDTLIHFHARITELLSLTHSNSGRDAPEAALRVQFWRSANMLVGDEEIHSKWSPVQSGTKKKRRIILNSRKEVFDLDHSKIVDSYFVERLLVKSLDFAPESLHQRLDEFVLFQDELCHLKLFSLAHSDLDAGETMCLFVNLYHCLLQHSLLLCLKAKLHSRSCLHFMRTMCYEIGGDVFSICELKDNLIRGNLCASGLNKAPYISPPGTNPNQCKLGYTTNLINFVLNTADFSFPRHVPLLRSSDVDFVLKQAAVEFIRRNTRIEGKRTLLIPRVFQVYGRDYGGDPSNPRSFLPFILPHLDQPLSSKINALLENETSFSVKYLPYSEDYHSVLSLDDISRKSHFPPS